MIIIAAMNMIGWSVACYILGLGIFRAMRYIERMP